MRPLSGKQVSAVANEPVRPNRAVEELHDHCDKLVVDRQSSEVLSLS